LLPGLLLPRQDSNLLQSHLDPVFADFAVMQAVDMNPGPVDAFIRPFLAHEGSLVGSSMAELLSTTLSPLQ